MKKEIKELCDKFNKSTEDWETFFSREIEKLLIQEKANWVEEIKQLILEDVPHQYQERLLKKVGENK